MLVQPDFSCLFAATTGQHGYFTTAQARACGFRSNLLHFHVRTGKFVHVHRGVYRLRDYPSSPREEVVAAWLAVGKHRAVVSHDSALDLHDLSDVIPDAVHLTVPRAVRHPPAIPGGVVHTTTRDLRPQDIVTRDGLRVTSAARTILDAAEIAVAPEQVEMAVRQAIVRGLTTRHRLEEDARQRSRRAYDLVTGVLARASR
ncbi:MAG: type IV toxin-antitoxin system AbiEi family antitoxin domain-containing protein [Thermomicrobiales bacterium]